MALKPELDEGRKLADWLDTGLHGLQFPYTRRFQISAAMLGQVIEHFRSIERLLRLQLIGSAFALLRAGFEGLVRALWIIFCATEGQIDAFAKGDKLPGNFGELINEVERVHPAFGGGFLSNIRREAWDAMCSYAHGGWLQAVRRMKPGEIAPDYSVGEQIEVLNAAKVFALLAAFEAATLAEKKEISDEILRRLDDAIT